MALTSASLPAKKRILTVCVKLFLEKGYKKATLAEIIEKADVSYSTFQNIFRAKDGVLTELVKFMFGNQFAMARSEAGAKLPPFSTLLTKITALAPWALATVAFSSKVVVPRFTTAILPLRSVAPVIPAAA